MEKYPLVRIRNIKVLIMYYVKILIFIFSCFFIVACGLKGPLYMPVQKSVENKGDVDKKATTTTAIVICFIGILLSMAFCFKNSGNLLSIML